MLQGLSHIDSVMIDIERDLLRATPVLDILAVALKSNSAGAARALATVAFQHATLADALSRFVPFDPAVLLYDHNGLQQIERARQCGQTVQYTSRLPQRWVDAIAVFINDTELPVENNSRLTSNAAMGAPPAAAMHVSRMAAYCSTLRVGQWPKNALIFLPLLLSHRIDEFDLVLRTAFGFLALSLAASAIYVLNDMLDLGNDRRHPVKFRRAFASGRLSISTAFWLAPLLVAAAASVALNLPPAFSLTLASYFILNLLYAFYLKRRLLVDVFALATSYTLRIIAGNAAGPIELSFWLLAFSLFLFFSLALVKRYVELDTVGSRMRQEKRVMGRGYRYADLDMLSQLGVSSAFSAVLVLALYVEKAGNTGLYTTPQLIWLICPIVLYVIGRIWVLAKRRELPDDPVRFILRDWRSHLMGFFVLTIMVAASCL